MGRKGVRFSPSESSFTAEAQPHQVDGTANSYEQADQGEDSLVEPLVQSVPNAPPENQP